MISPRCWMARSALELEIPLANCLRDHVARETTRPWSKGRNGVKVSAKH